MMPMNVLAAAIGLVLGSPLHPTHATTPGLGGGAAWTPAQWFQSGEQGAWYKPRERSTLAQNTAGTIPVTASGEPVAYMQDLSGSGNHATQSNDTLRPESWTDPATGEILLWFEDVVSTGIGMEWPITSMTGTIGIAYTTGAQVFNLTAGDVIPRGPMLEMVFIEGEPLSDMQCQILHAYLSEQVIDPTWHGYWPLVGPVLILTPAMNNFNDWLPVVQAANNADIRLQFSSDDELPLQWPEIEPTDMYSSSIMVMPEATHRQRFRYVTMNPEPTNVKFTERALFILPSSSSLTMPDPCIATNDALSPYYLNKGVSPGNAYGSVSWQLRGQTVSKRHMGLPSPSYDASFALAMPSYHYDPTGPWLVPTAETIAINVTAYGGAVGYPNEIIDLSPAPNLVYVYDVERNNGGYLLGDVLLPNATSHPNLEYMSLNGYCKVQAMPVFSEATKYISIVYSPGLAGNTITTDHFADDAYVEMEACGLVGTIPAVDASNVWRSRYWRFNAFTDIESGQITPGFAEVGHFRYNGNQLSQAAVDALLAEAVASDYVGAGTELRLQDNAYPSPAGLADRDTLIGRGWSVPISPPP